MTQRGGLIKAIGVVHSPYKQKFGTPRQSGLVPSSSGRLVLDCNYCPSGCLDGLEGFSHLWLIFSFHKNQVSNTQGKVHPPRLKGKKVGLFATRSPHRPNNLGLSLVKIESVDPDKLEIGISGLDLIDGTPIFDIKPYIASYDQVESSISGWVDETTDTIHEVVWQIESQALPEETKSLIEESLTRDLRSALDRGNDDKTFKSRISNWDVHFKYQGQRVLVTELVETKSLTLS